MFQRRSEVSAPIPNGRAPEFLRRSRENDRNGGEPDPADFEEVIEMPPAANLPATRGIGDRELRAMEEAMWRKPIGDVATAVTRLSYRHMSPSCGPPKIMVSQRTGDPQPEKKRRLMPRNTVETDTSESAFVWARTRWRWDFSNHRAHRNRSGSATGRPASSRTYLSSALTFARSPAGPSTCR